MCIPLHANLISFVLLGRLTGSPQDLVDINPEDHFHRQPWSSSPGETFHMTCDSHLVAWFNLWKILKTVLEIEVKLSDQRAKVILENYRMAGISFYLANVVKKHAGRPSSLIKTVFLEKKRCSTKMPFFRTLFSILVPISCPLGFRQVSSGLSRMRCLKP